MKFKIWQASLASRLFIHRLLSGKPIHEQTKGYYMKTFRTLDLAVQFHDLASEVKAPAYLRDQLLRASSSIALNLSEGNAKQSVKEKKRYYQTAYASLQECKTIFKLMKDENSPIVRLGDHLGASLYKLLNSETTTAITPRR
ncbi:MAG: four helix bundle protein [Deltaproteobacteria bacterium]|jgi:four helix bundle protein|nr:four helix bundle protein [Deltaproteobacteria bacterium]